MKRKRRAEQSKERNPNPNLNPNLNPNPNNKAHHTRQRLISSTEHTLRPGQRHSALGGDAEKDTVASDSYRSPKKDAQVTVQL